MSPAVAAVISGVPFSTCVIVMTWCGRLNDILLNEPFTELLNAITHFDVGYCLLSSDTYVCATVVFQQAILLRLDYFDLLWAFDM